MWQVVLAVFFPSSLLAVLMCFFSLLLFPVCFLSDLCRWVLASSSQDGKDETWLYPVPLSLWALAGSFQRIYSARSYETEQSKSLFSIMLLDFCISTLLWSPWNCVSDQTWKMPVASLCLYNHAVHYQCGEVPRSSNYGAVSSCRINSRKPATLALKFFFHPEKGMLSRKQVHSYL